MRGVTPAERAVLSEIGRHATHHEWDVVIPALVSQGRMVYVEWDEDGPCFAAITDAGKEALKIARLPYTNT